VNRREGSERWRIILDGKADGPTNMGVDQAIFRSVEIGASAPTLRFYGWDPPAVSLGRSQRPDLLDLEKCCELGIGVVCRPTGGKAVFHDRDVTYSLSCPIKSKILPNTLKGGYEAVSSCIVNGLSRLGKGIDPVMLPSGGINSRTACFEGPSAFEIVAGGKKLVGSAQRRGERAFLQHGSIPLEIQWDLLFLIFKDSSLPPKPRAVGLRECIGREIGEKEVIEALLKGFSETLGVVFQHGILTEEEHKMADWYRHNSILTL